MTEYEERRRENIRKNELLLQQLEVPKLTKKPAAKRQKTTHKTMSQPTRSSARIAATESQPNYAEKEQEPRFKHSRTSESRAENSAGTPKRSPENENDLKSLQAGWASWKAVEPLPTRDADGTFHFNSDSSFLPNKSPEELLREGSFGGTYFRPLYSGHLGITIEDDWQQLPQSWIDGLDVDRYLTSSDYDAAVNKYGVPCGQTIEQWEANGWINHTYDVRGWFQWYCRFFQGRRCPDDERQISRWRKFAGEGTGRWRTSLLKKYAAAGIRTVTDEGDDDIEGVSPAIHQTLHHWAFELRQHVLDEYLANN
jgi:hypothetical protein